MNDIQKLETITVKSLPEYSEMKENTIYLAENHTQATHLCPCGCKTEILTPFGRGGYRVVENEDKTLTLSPLIEHSPCSNPYKLYKGYVIWA